MIVSPIPRSMRPQGWRYIMLAERRRHFWRVSVSFVVLLSGSVVLCLLQQ